MTLEDRYSFRRSRGFFVENQLEALVRDYLALAALLERGLLSPSTRMRLEGFREALERDIAFLQNNTRNKSVS
jgi:hypothetical protein